MTARFRLWIYPAGKRRLEQGEKDELFREACKRSAEQLGDLVLMDRSEPAISTKDKRKQLRLGPGQWWLTDWTVEFIQWGEEDFSSDELQRICDAIAYHSETLLGYCINTEIVTAVS